MSCLKSLKYTNKYHNVLNKKHGIFYAYDLIEHGIKSNVGYYNIAAAQVTDTVLTRWYQVLSYVKDHPGCKLADIKSNCGIKPNSDGNLFSTMVKDKLLSMHRSGKNYFYNITVFGEDKLIQADKNSDILYNKLILRAQKNTEFYNKCKKIIRTSKINNL